ncbi:hypothetical protein BC940DRAFT_311072 [Gongronella butleri]|nr:hypothetical protein BC940DRAFT_311072 [Gongronella butleri]
MTSDKSHRHSLVSPPPPYTAAIAVVEKNVVVSLPHDESVHDTLGKMQQTITDTFVLLQQMETRLQRLEVTHATWLASHQIQKHTHPLHSNQHDAAASSSITPERRDKKEKSPLFVPQHETDIDAMTNSVQKLLQEAYRSLDQPHAASFADDVSSSSDQGGDDEFDDFDGALDADEIKKDALSLHLTRDQLDDYQARLDADVSHVLHLVDDALLDSLASPLPLSAIHTPPSTPLSTFAPFSPTASPEPQQVHHHHHHYYHHHHPTQPPLPKEPPEPPHPPPTATTSFFTAAWTNPAQFMQSLWTDAPADTPPEPPPPISSTLARHSSTTTLVVAQRRRAPLFYHLVIVALLLSRLVLVAKSGTGPASLHSLRQHPFWHRHPWLLCRLPQWLQRNPTLQPRLIALLSLLSMIYRLPPPIVS